MERAGLKPGLYNSEARNAGKMPALQNRNAPTGVGAQFYTEISYHNGNAGQAKNYGQKKEKSKPAALKTKAAAPHDCLRPPPNDKILVLPVNFSYSLFTSPEICPQHRNLVQARRSPR